MKLTYIANYRLPTEKAHGIQIAKTCEALGKLVDLTLVYPKRKNDIKEDVFEYYGVEKTFKTQIVRCPEFRWLGEKLSFLVKTFVCAIILSLKAPKADIYYTRDELIAFFKNAVFECHKYSKIKSFLYPKRIVAISQVLADKFKNAVVARDGVDLKMFDIEGEKGDLIIYTGQTWKGTKMPSNITWIKNKPYKEIPKYLKQAKMLILPNTNKDPYTSPMKMFEYMASGVPIVATNIPAIREVLNENNAVLIEPDNLDEGIRRLEDEELGKKLAEQARKDVEQHTWDKRAEIILNFLNENISRTKFNT